MIKRAILFLIAISVPALPVTAMDQHYSHDDGSSETALGFFSGDQVWLQYFDPLGGTDTITHFSVAIGSPQTSGMGPSPGTELTMYIWDDPNNDGDPTDAVLLGSGTRGVWHPDTDLGVYCALDNPVTVTSRFFVGVKINCSSSRLPKALDQSQPSNGRAWAAGDAGGGFNAYNLTDNSHPPVDLDETANPGVWLLRAHHLQYDVYCDSFDATYGGSNPVWWTEQAGDWAVVGSRLRSENLAASQEITADRIDQTDGCVQLQCFYGDGVGSRAAGAVVRYLTAGDRILVKLQENGTNGFFNACYVYDGGSTVFSVQGQNFGTEPVLQVQYTGSQVTVRVDVDNDGVWDHVYPVSVSTVHGGLTGITAYNQCEMDDWCSGPAADSWGGTVTGFQGVPEQYWQEGGGQDLGGYYPGLTFSPGAAVLEETVYGYNHWAFPWHSFDAVIGPAGLTQMRVDFDEPKTHVGFWYSTNAGAAFAEAYDAGGTLLDNATLLENEGRNSYATLDAPLFCDRGQSISIEIGQWSEPMTSM